MGSPVFNAFNNGSGPFQNLSNMLSRFNEFKQNFTGNPEEIVKAKLASGEMSKEQYEECCKMANQMMGLFGKRNN